MAIDWKGVFNRTPDALNKLVSIGLSIDQYKIQRDMQQSIWSGRCYYAPMGGGMYGGGYSGNTWDIIQAGMGRMTDLTNRKLSELRNGGGTGCIGGGAGSEGSSTSQAQVAPEQGQNLANGRDTTFIDNNEWSDLKAKVKAGNASDDEKTKLKNYYKSSLKSLITSFKQTIDKDRDGKISQPEFVDYFKTMMSAKYRAEGKTDQQITDLANKAWKNINFNQDFNNSLDDDELVAFLSTLDNVSFDDADGKITADEIKTGLDAIAEESVKVADKLTELNTTPPSSQPQTGNDPTDDDPTDNDPPDNNPTAA